MRERGKDRERGGVGERQKCIEVKTGRGRQAKCGRETKKGRQAK